MIKSLGRPSLTSPPAKKLNSLGIGYTELLQLREDSGTTEVFLTALKDKGIRSKSLREKLAKAIAPAESSQFILFYYIPGSFQSHCIHKRFHLVGSSCSR